ncbi:fatty-acyl-CoA synthase [Blastococcus colisei]|uniref:Fatty-acyl-CoA synthase n=1 Tax=Blastococcus colisei TaxID=1564162 RepID=A0A543PFH8_9ACTN|nr:long-chain fatty acid--CoA ligase [Blastococcus colisei]TQN42816.1 fatty-acyl-CoA synthase [Blastococcus colisei]
MRGLMMDRPLLLRSFLQRNEQLHGRRTVSAVADDGLVTRTYADIGRRARLLASGLAGIGIGTGDRVATIGWNTLTHFEAYFAVPCMGAVLHTVNFRLFPDQVAYILGHAGSRAVLIDADQWPLLEQVIDRCPDLQTIVVMNGPPPGSRLAGRAVHGYEDVIAAGDADYDFPEFDENTAAGLCYTSATTGNPKGVLYSHRSMVLHSLAHCLADAFGLSERMRILVATPMFHANAWGIPHSAALTGAVLVLPGRAPDAARLVGLVEDLQVTHLCGAVSVGVMIRDFVDPAAARHDLTSLEAVWLGGQAPTEALVRWFEEHAGAEVWQGWGMTEASPLATFNHVDHDLRAEPTEDRHRRALRQGAPLPLVELALVDKDGHSVPWNGTSVGEFRLRGPWIAREYFDDPERTAEVFVDGWYRTGDVGVVDPDGYMRLHDREKDLIKSGGEWISSVELENALQAHPGVSEAVVVAVPHEKWRERPLACIVPADRANPPDPAELDDFLAARVAKWWIPDRYEFVSSIPKTGVGKTDKKQVREQFRS